MSSTAFGRAAIARLWRADERDCVPPLIEVAQLEPSQRERVAARTRSLIEGMRRHGGGEGSGEGVEALTRAFPLNSPAGLALLSLAESLLRIPDRANVNRLLRDRLSQIDWSAQPRGGFLARSLGLASRALADSSLIASLATPIVRSVAQMAIKALGAQFVFAEDIRFGTRDARTGAIAATTATPSICWARPHSPSTMRSAICAPTRGRSTLLARRTAGAGRWRAAACR